MPSNSDTNTTGVQSVSCAAIGSCVAVGTYYAPNTEFFIDTLSEGTWSTVEVPLPSGATAVAGQRITVTCVLNGSCVVEGNYVIGTSINAFFETLFGGTWTYSEAPVPSNTATPPYFQFYSVACASDGSCTAVGEYTDDSGNSPTFIDTLSGGTWSATEAPLPSGGLDSAYSDLDSVSCSPDGSCVAVGSYSIGSEGDQGLIDTLSGGTWSATEAPLPSGGLDSADSDLDSVSCSPDGSCVAVGSYNSGSQGLIETSIGGIWTATDAPLPSNGLWESLESVSCSSVKSCAAVGSFGNTHSGVGSGLIDTLSDTTWSATESPLPSNGLSDTGRLYSVACPAAAACVATGYYQLPTGDTVGLIEMQSGRTIVSQIALSPPAQSAILNQSVPIVARLAHAHGQSISGVLVNFSVVSGPDQGKTGSAITHANGSALYNLTNGGLSGTDIVQASAAGSTLTSNQVTVTFAFSPLAVNVTESDAPMHADPTQIADVQLNVKVTGTNGVPVSGATVNVPGPVPILGTGVTNNQGKVSVSFPVLFGNTTATVYSTLGIQTGQADVALYSQNVLGQCDFPGDPNQLNALSSILDDLLPAATAASYIDAFLNWIGLIDTALGTIPPNVATQVTGWSFTGRSIHTIYALDVSVVDQSGNNLTDSTEFSHRSALTDLTTGQAKGLLPLQQIEAKLHCGPIA